MISNVCSATAKRLWGPFCCRNFDNFILSFGYTLSIYNSECIFKVFVDLVGLIDPVVVVVVAIVVVVAAAAAAADIVVVVVVVVGKYAAVKLYFNMCQCVYCVCLWMWIHLNQKNAWIVHIFWNLGCANKAHLNFDLETVQAICNFLSVTLARNFQNLLVIVSAELPGLCCHWLFINFTLSFYTHLYIFQAENFAQQKVSKSF